MSNAEGINQEASLAQALLGLLPGGIGEFEVPRQKPRELRVLKIQR